MRAFIKKFRTALTTLAITPFLFGCNPDDMAFDMVPVILTPIAKVALEGNDVNVTLSVLNAPDSVSCFDGAVTLTAEENGTTYTGTVGQSLLILGHNAVDCSASNSMGEFAMNVGSIFVLGINSTPEISGVNSVTFNDGDGLVSIDETLIATSTNVQGATYALSDGDTLPAGLSIDETNGNLIGSIDVTEQQIFNIAVKATTVAGSGVTGDITITINDSSAL